MTATWMATACRLTTPRARSGSSCARRRSRRRRSSRSPYVARQDGDRPVTFVFNGGPGASSAYLHMGAVGPSRVVFPADGSLPPMPPRLVANEESWLAFTDLVFVDPVGTGFSRVIEDEARGRRRRRTRRTVMATPTEYFGYKRDLESLCEFMGRWLSGHGRWGSPVFIAGESYGGYRVGRLVRMLQETAGIGLNGAVLISPALEFASLAADRLRRARVDRSPADDGDRRRPPRPLARVRGRHAGRGGPSQRRSSSPLASTPPSSRAARRCRRPSASGSSGGSPTSSAFPCEMVDARGGPHHHRHVHARAAPRRAEGARALRRDDHDDRSVPRSGVVRRPRSDARGHRVRRTRWRSTGSCARRSASRPTASTRC